MLHISTMVMNHQAKRRNLLRYRNGPTEFEVQAFLYWELQRLGYHVRGEVVCFSGKARFDLAIYDHNISKKAPIRIIEVKRRKRSSDSSTISGGQVHRYYEDYGVPVDLVGGMEEARRYIQEIVSVLGVAAPRLNR